MSDAFAQLLLDQYWPCVQKCTDGCWSWHGRKGESGRGIVPLGDGSSASAPRVAWYAEYGEWPPEHLHVCHSCDNPNCVKPAHLWLGTRSQNMRDAMGKGRLVVPGLQPGFVGWNALKTHCAHGHPFDDENTLHVRGQRMCRACKRIAEVKFRKSGKKSASRRLRKAEIRLRQFSAQCLRMDLENRMRVNSGCSPAYIAQHFNELAARIRATKVAVDDAVLLQGIRG